MKIINLLGLSFCFFLAQKLLFFFSHILEVELSFLSGLLMDLFCQYWISDRNTRLSIWATIKRIFFSWRFPRDIFVVGGNLGDSSCFLDVFARRRARLESLYCPLLHPLDSKWSLGVIRVLPLSDVSLRFWDNERALLSQILGGVFFYWLVM